jgi:hypothetical protein
VTSGDFFKEHAAYCEQFDPGQVLARIGWSAEQCLQEATNVLYQAQSIDPLAEWQDLVRLCHHEKLAKLKGAALLACDMRVAAEILLRFYEDLAAQGLAPQLQPNSPVVERERLTSDGSEVDRILMEYDLSPHPSLVLALEGETEMVIMPKVMDHLGIRRNPSFLRHFNYGGIDKGFDLLVQYIVTPFLGDPRQGSNKQTVVPFERPPTKFLLIADPESRFTTDAQRAKWRNDRLSEICAALPSEFQTDGARWQLGQLVEIDSWGAGQCFEFANFDDGELAQALGVPQQEVAVLRQGGRFSKKKLKELWGRLAHLGYSLPAEEPPTKVEIAHALWPLLEARIAAAQQTDDVQAIPVVRIAVRAWRLAAGTRRGNVALFPEHAAPSNGTAITDHTGGMADAHDQS